MLVRLRCSVNMNACELALQAKECYARPNYFGRACIGVKVLPINRCAFILVMKVAGTRV